MKTTIRATVTLPEAIATITRLYDLGTTWELKKDHMTDPDKIADFINQIKAEGGKEVASNHYIGDDDFLPHFEVTYELTKEM